MDRVRIGRNDEQPQRDRRPGHAVLERPAAGAGGVRRQRLRRAESAAAAFRPGQERASRKGRDSLAIGQGADHRQARHRPVAQDQGGHELAGEARPERAREGARAAGLPTRMPERRVRRPSAIGRSPEASAGIKRRASERTPTADTSPVEVACQSRQSVCSAGFHHAAFCWWVTCRSASSKAGRRRCWRSSSASRSSWCSAAFSIASGFIPPAPTSPASASAF